MGCTGCTVGSNNGSPAGCRNNGGCGSGGCNRLNTYDWLATMEIEDPDAFDVVEVSFKNGARKNFFRNNSQQSRAITGDMVVVETGTGHDVGRISLSGELVRLQLRKKKVNDADILHNVVRRANERDLKRLQECRDLEGPTMIRARAIARTLDLEMKVGDVEYQGDKRKATFYYTADGRVDFRELIRHYAKEFRVKIEMRQIGARQESARIGGLGSCGRELCCSTWLTDFKSVSTSAARYQNLAINQSKLSGQCGRLKCCLNYELDTYLDALEDFPSGAEKLETEAGVAQLVKTDIFKGLMYYAYFGGNGRSKSYVLSLEQVATIKEMNANGEKPQDLMGMQVLFETQDEEIDFEDVTGVIELPAEKRRKRRNKKRKRPNRGKGSGDKTASGKKEGQGRNQKGGTRTGQKGGGKKRSNRGRNRRKNNNKTNT